MTKTDIARICHEINRAYCESLGDKSQVSWENAPEWQRTSAIKGVEFHIANPHAPASASHESWMAEKRATGWTYGPVKDAEKKTHPCFVPFEQLPKEQQAKDYLFKATIHSLIPLLDEDDCRIEAARTEMKHGRTATEVIEATRKYRILQNKSLRRKLTDIEQALVTSGIKSRNRAIAITAVEDACMRLGKDLSECAEPNPYPNSLDTSNTKVDPTAPEAAPRKVGCQPAGESA